MIRWRNIVASSVWFWAARRRPRHTRKLLLDRVRCELPDGFDVAKHFSPSYDPWDQRICAVPDGDFFRAIRSGAVTVVTDEIETLSENGVVLRSGRELPCDLIVTATGLNVQLLGGAELVVDGTTLRTGELTSYKGLMYADVPNLTVTFGYVNASWTLKADLTSEYTCRLLTHMDRVGAVRATPRRGSTGVEHDRRPTFTPGYLRRSADLLPRQGVRKPWRLADNYPLDLLALRFGRIDDGVLELATASTVRPSQRATPAAGVVLGRSWNTSS